MSLPYEIPEDLAGIFAALHDGRNYDSGDPKLCEIQRACREKQRDYNLTGPNELKKREAILKDFFYEIGEGCYVEPPLYANWGAHTHFGKFVYANFGLTLTDDTHIYVGDYVMIGPHVTLVTAAHPLAPEARKLGFQNNAPVKIENCVWLGAGVIVLPGVTIGENSIIGAGSVVTRDIPPNVVAFGVPCRVHRKLTQEDLDWKKNAYFREK